MISNDGTINLIKKVERLETVREYSIRLLYLFFSIPVFTWLFKEDKLNILHNDLDFEMGMLKIYGSVAIIMLIGILPILFTVLIEKKRIPLFAKFESYKIKQPIWYAPILLFVLYLGTLWIEISFPFIKWIIFIISVILIEYFFYRKREAYNMLKSKLKSEI